MRTHVILSFSMSSSIIGDVKHSPFSLQCRLAEAKSGLLETKGVKIPLSRIYIDDTIKQKVLEVIDSENFILGKQCEAFEKELAAYTGVKHCVLSSSWTAAVHLLLLALNLKEGDEVL